METVAGKPTRTTVRHDPGCLFRQKGGWINDLSLKGNFFTCTLTIRDFYYFPISISHRFSSGLENFNQ
jgi:hypothetical protein